MNLPGTRTLGLGLIILSLLPLSRSASLFSEQKQFMAESTTRQAVVIEHRPVSGSSSKTGSGELLPIVEYWDSDGKRQTATGNVSSYPAPHAIGEEIEVLIQPDDPTRVRVLSFTGMWFETAYFLIPGLLAFAAGLLMTWRARST